MKFIKIFTINAILIFLIILVFEFCCAFITFQYTVPSNKNFAGKLSDTVKYIKIHYNVPPKTDYKTAIRKPALAANSKKSPVLLLGCSFAYGDKLNDNEAFHSVLSKYTGRTVYNLGMCCASPREMFYILSNKETQADLLDNTDNFEYVIYTYITAHKKRMYTNICQFRYIPYFTTDKNFSSLKYRKPNKILDFSFAVNCIKLFYYTKIINKSKQDSKFLLLYLREMNKLSKELFKPQNGKQVKFVVLVYEDFDNEQWEILKKEGIIIINANELVNDNLIYSQYRLPDKHPNAKAWELIVPALAKELKL